MENLVSIWQTSVENHSACLDHEIKLFATQTNGSKPASEGGAYPVVVTQWGAHG
jgi:hypothetical protein